MPRFRSPSALTFVCVLPLLACDVEESDDPCGAPKAAGQCAAAIPRWWHNPETNRCEPFLYGGCGGNANRYDTAAACQQSCGGTAATSGNHPHAEEDSGGQSSLDYCDTCRPEVQVAERAHSEAVDCGTVLLGDEPDQARACVETALADGQPFQLRQALQGIDSAVEVAFFVDAQGEVQQLFYDSNTCGGGSSCDASCGPRISVGPCENPRVQSAETDPAGTPLVTCDEESESEVVCAAPR